MREIVCQMKGYIQPFERRLALEELKALTSSHPKPIDENDDGALQFRVRTNASLQTLTRQLAYWQTIGSDRRYITSQLQSEATSIIARNGVSLDELPFAVPMLVNTKLPNKRCLRYATHGLHEYRGKFFPQLVRALINVSQIPSDGVVLDPMSGSGTTLVEAVLSGRHAYGLDMNPLSVFISQVKCRALTLEPKVLIKAFNTLKSILESNPDHPKSSHFSTLAVIDREYLKKWFAAPVLEELDRIQGAIESVSPSVVRQFYHLCLSNILRAVSWQKLDDLRVRKELRNVSRREVVVRFLDEAQRSTKTLVAFISQRDRKRLGHYDIREADARCAATELAALKDQVDVVITSPPYATALPYLDTDRLSLIYLGLLPRPEHRPRDALMIGNREITERARLDYWETYLTHRKQLPKATRSLIEQIDLLNARGDVGFRRRNLSALLAKYFFDMRAVIDEQFSLLRRGGLMFMVVGNNRTTAGGEEIEIQTTRHLIEIAKLTGFRAICSLSMEMLNSRDIFRKNAMPSEEIMTFKKG